MNEDRTPRIPPVNAIDQLADEDRHHFEYIADTRGEVRGPFSVLLRSPEVAGRVGRLGEYLRFDSIVPQHYRELAILTTARSLECPYEWAVHEPLAREAGVGRDAIDAVISQARIDDLPDEERTVIRFGRELFGSGSPTPETFQRAESSFDDQGVLELTAIFGYYAMLAHVCNSFDIEPDDPYDVPWRSG